MNDSLSNLNKYVMSMFSQHYFEFKKLSESNSRPPKPLVSNTKKAFSFDEITLAYVERPSTPCSADSLYFTKSVNFIEFKRAIPQCFDDSGNVVIKHFEIFNNLKLKAVESVSTLNNIIIPSCPKKIDVTEITTKYVVVIDSTSFASVALANAYAEMVSSATAPVTKQSSLEQSLQRFKAKDKYGHKIYYDDVLIWNDVVFDAKISTL